MAKGRQARPRLRRGSEQKGYASEAIRSVRDKFYTSFEVKICLANGVHFKYCSDDFQKMLKTHAMVSSMSRKGNCWDNSVAESFFGSLKTERVFFTNYKSRDEARKDIVDYIEMFYNSKRRHSYLGYVSPREFEEMRLLEKAA